MTDSLEDTAEDISEAEVDFEGLQDMPNPDPNGQDVGGNTHDLVDFLKSKSPEKDLSEYEGHTLDFDSTDSTRRLIRGIEGLLGATNYALADVVIGIAQKISGIAQEESGEEGWQEP
jgi:hypothetical protein